MSIHTDRHVVLAAMLNGEHIQVGADSSHDGAHTLWAQLDGDLRAPHGRGTKRHSIKGEPVRFYRVRHVGHVDCPVFDTIGLNNLATSY